MTEKFCAKARAAKVLNEASVGGPILRVLVDEDWEMTMSRGGFRASSSLGAPNSATLCLFVGGAVEWDDDFKMYRFDIGSRLKARAPSHHLFVWRPPLFPTRRISSLHLVSREFIGLSMKGVRESVQVAKKLKKPRSPGAPM